MEILWHTEGGNNLLEDSFIFKDDGTEHDKSQDISNVEDSPAPIGKDKYTKEGDPLNASTTLNFKNSLRPNGNEDEMIGQNEKTNKRSVEKQNIKRSDERDN
jgi:hypothetical protein